MRIEKAFPFRHDIGISCLPEFLLNPENSNMQPLAKWLLINYQKAVTRDRKRDTPGGEVV